MSAAEYARTEAARTQDLWKVTRRMALSNVIRVRGRELGLSNAEVAKVTAAAEERALKEWGR